MKKKIVGKTISVRKTKKGLIWKVQMINKKFWKEFLNL